jgi:hypothetical protein
VVFAILLGMMDAAQAAASVSGEAGTVLEAAAQSGRLSTGQIVGLTLGFGAFVLTVGRWLIDKSLPWLQAHTTWPGGILSFALGITLLGGGLHGVAGHPRDFRGVSGGRGAGRFAPPPQPDALAH